ncbi:MAG: HD domain-containing protein [Fibrobacteres bacterium]|jgi:HD-GYP domain-containing protein (c-di-GMP phosphodiesterase class II)|nr:HD domain-containing protein [Fibrobacterota bacterium]
MERPPILWDNRRDREVRQTMSELKALEEKGYFDGLGLTASDAEDPKAREAVETLLLRSAPFLRRVSSFKPLDNPVGPALAQFMTQLRPRERTEIYKNETHKRFQDAVGQVRILYGKILRGEIASNAIVRSIVGSFMDTFMKDRNLLLNLASAPHAGHDYLFDHSLKQCLLSLSLASAAGYSRSQSIEIAQGALLADVGMMLVPERIRLKRGKLSEGEIFEVRKHPMLGMTLLEHVHGLSEAALLIPYQHHERMGGGGYPDKRAGAAVSRFSRIVSIADVFTALISPRTYRDSMLPYQAMVSLLTLGGAGQLDGDHIKQFLKTMSMFPLGSLVRLSSGRVAKVVAPNPMEFTKPMVSLLTDESGASLPRAAIAQIDLADSLEKIVEALPGASIPQQILDGF